MSDTILSGDFTVYYESENRQKRIVYTGSGTKYTVKSLYLALQDLFDELTQMDDGTPMSAQTPTEYTIGIIDPGDDDPWFIDPTSVEYLYGGALKTADWKRVVDSNTGIVRVTVSSSAIVAGDIGYDISHNTDSDAGTLLAIQDLGSGNQELWIRPDTSGSANNFDSSSGSLTCNGHTAVQGAAATTGEMLWANIYGLGTLATDTHLFIYQGEQTGDTAPDALLTQYQKTGTPRDWWSDGFFDILVLVADQSSDLSTRSTFIDEGYITVLARQYTKTYTYYTVDLFAGGRNPIPLETGADLNNDEGYKSVTLGTSSGNWSVGDEIEGKVSGARGIITATSGSNPTITLEFYYIGKSPFIVFNGSEGIQNNDDTGDSSSSGAVSSAAPESFSGITITHANTTADVNQDGTNENYSITINVNNYSLANLYEWLKWKTRRGDVTTTFTDGIEAEQYLGSDYRVTYTGTVTGTVAEGDVVEGVTSGATATVVAHHTTAKICILRNTRGTFQSAEQIQVDAGNYIPASGTTVASISPIKACPFGTFAGGVLFGAPGVVLTNYQGGEVNSFILSDDTGTQRQAPTSVAVTVSNTRINDRVAVFRLTAAGGNIKKDEYALDTGASAGDTTLSVDPAITQDTPGKSTGGVLFVISGTVEYRYRYTGWSGDDFTLFQLTQSTATGGDADTLTDSGATFITSGVKVGDIIRNVTEATYAYVTAVVSETELTTTPVTDWNGDTYRIGAVVATHSVSDDLYVPIIHSHETAGTDASEGSESISMVYNADIPVRVRVRHANDTSYNIKPFESEGTILSTGLTVRTVRTPETITS